MGAGREPLVARRRPFLTIRWAPHSELRSGELDRQAKDFPSELIDSLPRGTVGLHRSLSYVLFLTPADWQSDRDGGQVR